MVVSSPQYGENTAFFSAFPLGGIHGQGILPVTPLEFQGKKHQPFSITQPSKKQNESVMKPTKDEKALLYHLIGYDIAGIAFVKLLALSYHVVVLSPQYGENTEFFSHFLRRWMPCLGHFAGYSFGISRNKTSAISYDTAKQMIMEQDNEY